MKNLFTMMLAAFALVIFSTTGYAHSNYIGYSGAPGSGGSCASSCHGSLGGTIEISGFPAEYSPGQTYSIAVSHAGGSAIKQFNGSCRIGSGSENAGTLVAGTNTATYNTSGETNGIHLSSNDLNSGTFAWTAPLSGTGEVRLYIAGHQGPVSGPNTSLVVVSSEMATDVRGDGPLSAPHEPKLGDNYPNPFNAGTSIEFTLPRRSHVIIEIFNVLGKRVARLADDDYGAGHHKVSWNGTSFGGKAVSSGIYFYRMVAGDFTKTRKMLLLE